MADSDDAQPAANEPPTEVGPVANPAAAPDAPAADSSASGFGPMVRPSRAPPATDHGRREWNCRVFGQAGSPTSNPVFFPKGPPPPPGADLQALLQAPPGSSDEDQPSGTAAEPSSTDCLERTEGSTTLLDPPANELSMEAEEDRESEHPCEDDECVGVFSATEEAAAGPVSGPATAAASGAEADATDSSSDGFSPLSPDSDDFGHEAGTKD